MANAQDIVEQYFSALYGRETQTARQYLADDLSFSGPAATFSSADQYLRATAHAVEAVRRVEKRKVFVDGPDVCMFYDLHIDQPAISVPVAEWYHVDRERIVSIRTILDTDVALQVEPTATLSVTRSRREMARSLRCRAWAAEHGRAVRAESGFEPTGRGATLDDWICERRTRLLRGFRESWPGPLGGDLDSDAVDAGHRCESLRPDGVSVHRSQWERQRLQLAGSPGFFHCPGYRHVANQAGPGIGFSLR
jgi:SnoaL-like domain